MIIDSVSGRTEVVRCSATEAAAECRSILNATRQYETDPRRFQWLYCDNPDGEAPVWVARRGDTGEAVGFAVALPRRMLVRGEVRLCWNGADASVLAKFRGQGVATRLRAATRAAVDSGGADFFYAHPNDRMAGAHARAGHVPIGSMIRLAKPLRLGAFITEKLGVPRLGAVAGAVLDPVRRWTDLIVRRPSNLRVRAAEWTEVDSRFDDLFRRTVKGFTGVVGVRDARYLRWRYRDNPLYTTDMLLAEDDGKPAGYLLFVKEGDEVHVKDIFPMHQPAVVLALVAELTRAGYGDGWRSISMTILESNPLRPTLQSLGFRRRAETSQMFGYCPAERPWSAAVFDQSAWWLTVGDRDI